MPKGSEKKMGNVRCSVCHQAAFSWPGKACKTCGMPMADKGRDFCSKSCRELFGGIAGGVPEQRKTHARQQENSFEQGVMVI